MGGAEDDGFENVFYDNKAVTFDDGYATLHDLPRSVWEQVISNVCGATGGLPEVLLIVDDVAYQLTEGREAFDYFSDGTPEIGVGSVTMDPREGGGSWTTVYHSELANTTHRIRLAGTPECK